MKAQYEPVVALGNTKLKALLEEQEAGLLMGGKGSAERG